MKLLLLLALCATAAAEPRQPERVPSLEGPPSIAYIMRPPTVDTGMAIAPPSIDQEILLGTKVLLGTMPAALAQLTDALVRAVVWLVPTAT